MSSTAGSSAAGSTGATISGTGAQPAAPSTGEGQAQRSDAPGRFYSWQGKDVLLIPHDQAAAFDRSTAGGRDVLVVVPYDRYVTTTPTAGGPGSQFFAGKEHVLLLVPNDQLARLSQISTGDRQILVVMPLEQFHRVADISKLQGSSLAAGTMTESREATSFRPSTAAPSAGLYAEPSRTYFLHDLGEASAINHWYPVAGGTIISLRDGTTLMVPASVEIDSGLLRQGNRVRGEIEQRGGENLVTWLEITPRHGDTNADNN
jgi:hypothetical protein